MKDKIGVCNLCSAELPCDDLWENRASQHEQWHTPRLVANRTYVNTVHGIIKWKYKYV